MNVRLAAYVATAILLCVAIFQLLLALGMPLGDRAWGGAHEVLPTPLRIGSAIAIFIYLLAALIVLSRAGVFNVITNQNVTYYGTWVLTVFFAIGVPLNAISRSPAERLNAPIILVLAVMCYFVARSPRDMPRAIGPSAIDVAR